MAGHYQARKRLIARRDGGYFCAYCGKPGTRASLTVDHVVPRSAGGGGLKSNLVLACEPCNRAKGTERWIPRAGANP